MDKGKALRFQSKAGLVTDGKPGPGTLKALVTKGSVCDLPLVFYWPRAATSRTVLAYRRDLNAMADKVSAAGNSTCANELRASAARERGQGGVAGYVPA